MKTYIHLASLLILLATATGCAKFKELTRRDYALIRDPFAAKTATAEAEPPVDAKRSTSGFVRIDDTEPKAADPVKADYSTVAQSSPAAASNSTGFQGIRVRGMGDAISSEIGTATRPLESAAAAVASTADTIPNQAEAATANVQKTVEKKTAAFDVVQSQSLADGGFTEWAASEAEKWKSTQPTDKEKATPLLNRIQQVSKTVAHAEDASSEVASPLVNQRQEAARPLITSKAAAPPLAKREMLRLKQKPAATPTQPPPVGAANPFAGLDVKPVPSRSSAVAIESPAPDFDDFTASNSTAAAPEKPKPLPSNQAGSNPFAAFETPPKKSSVSKSNKAASLDSGFNFDTGWRPSDAEAP